MSNKMMALGRTFYDGGEGEGGGEPITVEVHETAVKEALAKMPEGAFTAEGWRDALSETIRTDASFAKITSLEHLGSSFISTQKLLGKDPTRVMELPAADDAVAITTLRTKMGLPAGAADYKIEAVDKAPEWLAPGGELGKAFAGAAHAAELLPAQAQGIYSWFSEAMMAAQSEKDTQVTEAAAESVRSIEAKWGEAYDKKTAYANLAVDKFGGEELRKVIDGAFLGANPHMMDLLSSFGEMLVEDKGAGGDLNFGSGETPDQLRSQANELLRQAINSDSPSEKKRLNEKAQALFARTNKKVITA